MPNYSLLQKQFLVNTYVNRGITLTKGEGVYLYGENKNKYLDCMSNYGVNILGHSHPIITEALAKQLSKLTVLHSSFGNDVRAKSAYELIKRVRGGVTNVYFSNSGAEAIEAALKFAVFATGKKQFIACKNAFHGKTLGALSATGEEKYRDPFKPLLWNFTHINYNDVNALEKNITRDTAAFIVEPIQGEGGIFPPNVTYIKEVRKVCDEKGVLMIIDEIQTGCGRTGSFLASQNSNINYDIICLGKGLAGGIPVGVTLVSEKIATKITRGINTSTFGGNPLACAGILETLKLLDKKMLEYVIEMGDYFLRQLKKIKSSLIRDVRGKGLMIGIEVKDKRNDILKALQQRYILAIPAGENVVRLLPPFIIEKRHIDLTVSVLKRIFESI